MNPIATTVCLSLFPSGFTDRYRIIGFRKKFSFSGTTSFDCRCVKNDENSGNQELLFDCEGDLDSLSRVLETNDEHDIVSMWSSLALYVFSIHVPLSFGGLSAATKILHQQTLDLQSMPFLILGIQMLELSIVLLLLKWPGEPKASQGRSSLQASLLGSGMLISIVFITAFIADKLPGDKESSNKILGEILASGSISSSVACILALCVITPILEEVVYRGFLLTGLAASRIPWPQAVIVSSVVFSAAHFSGENFLRLFVVGIVLGCAYCWTGKLSSSIAIHSFYNAVVLLLAFQSFLNS